MRDLCCELLYPFMYRLAGREDYWVGEFCANVSGSPPASAHLILSLAKQLNSNGLALQPAGLTSTLCAPSNTVHSSHPIPTPTPSVHFRVWDPTSLGKERPREKVHLNKCIYLDPGQGLGELRLLSVNERLNLF